jgi:exosortase
MATQLESIPAETRKSPETIPLRVVAIFLGLGYLPLLAFMAVNLWRKEHYQHFPFVVITVAVLAYLRLPLVQPLAPSYPWPRRILIGTSVLLLAAGTALFSPFLGLLAALVGTLAVAYTLGGRPLLRAWLPLFAALCLIVPLPGNLDEALIARLQTIVVGLASRALDVLGVLHFRAGNVLEVPGKRLLVDEACSGINGLQSGLAFVLIYSIAMRRRPIVAVPLLLLTCGWVVVVNVFRVTVIGWADASLGIDLSQGLAHKLLGLSTFAVVLGLVLSSEQLIFFIKPRWARPNMRSNTASEALPEVSPEQPQPGSSATWLTSYACLGAIAALGILHVGEWGFHWKNAPASAPEAGKAPRLEMPAQFAGWERVDDNPLEHSTAIGIDSQAWALRKGNLIVVVSLDAPHRGFHPLEMCYDGSGWIMDQVKRFDAGDASIRFPRSELFMHRQNGRNGLVVYSHLGEDGKWISPVRDVDWVNQSTWEDYKVRLFRRTHGQIFEPISYQMQLFVDRATPVTPQELGDIRQLFSNLLPYWNEQLIQTRRVIGP